MIIKYNGIMVYNFKYTSGYSRFGICVPFGQFVKIPIFFLTIVLNTTHYTENSIDCKNSIKLFYYTKKKKKMSTA